jgi:hypothetical protein
MHSILWLLFALLKFCEACEYHIIIYVRASEFAQNNGDYGHFNVE